MLCPNCGTNLPDTATMCYACKRTIVRKEGRKVSSDNDGNPVVDANDGTWQILNLLYHVAQGKLYRACTREDAHALSTLRRGLV